jgi:hypothetical protein
MTAFTYDDAYFRASFPALADVNSYPQAVVSNYFTLGGSYIANTNYGRLNGDNKKYALNLITAHLALLNTLISEGGNPAIITSSGIDKINVTLAPPPAKNMFDYWLSTTPYGLQIMALMQGIAVGGFSIGGSLARSGFRGSNALLWC